MIGASSVGASLSIIFSRVEIYIYKGRFIGTVLKIKIKNLLVIRLSRILSEGQSEAGC